MNLWPIGLGRYARQR